MRVEQEEAEWDLNPGPRDLTSTGFRGALPLAFDFVLTTDKQFRCPEWKVSPLYRLLLSDDLISPEKPLAKSLLVWPATRAWLPQSCPASGQTLEGITERPGEEPGKDVVAGSVSVSPEPADLFVSLSQY